MIAGKLDDPRLALDVLLRDGEEAKAHPELWTGLHEAAVRDDRVLELASAYEEIHKRRDLANVPIENQVILLFNAGVFFAAILGDDEAAHNLLSRVITLDPNHAEAFEILERRRKIANDNPGLADLYATVAAAKQDRNVQTQLMRKAMTIVEALPTGELERAIKVLEKLCAIEPANAWYRAALETRYTRARRFRDLAALLERALTVTKGEHERHALQVRLIQLYLGDAATPDKAIDHVEELLRRDPHDEAGTKGCDALLKHPSVAKRAAEALQDRRRRLAK